MWHCVQQSGVAFCIYYWDPLDSELSKSGKIGTLGLLLQYIYI